MTERSPSQQRIQDFSDGIGTSSKEKGINLLFYQNLTTNCMKMKEIRPRGATSVVRLADPPLKVSKTAVNMRTTVPPSAEIFTTRNSSCLKVMFFSGVCLSMGEGASQHAIGLAQVTWLTSSILECIPVGCVPPVCWPYPSMHCAGGSASGPRWVSGGGVSTSGPGGRVYASM